MKIVNVKRFIRSIILVLGVMVILSLMLVKPTFSYKELEYKAIYVSEGETLWGLAEELQESNEYYKGKDVRYIIDSLMNINNLNSKTLAVGQKLQVPIA